MSYSDDWEASEELPVETENMVQGVKAMDIYLSTYFPHMQADNRALLAAQVIQCSLLGECVKRLTKIERKP